MLKKIILYSSVIAIGIECQAATKYTNVEVFTTDSVPPYVISNNEIQLGGLIGEFLVNSTKNVIKNFNVHVYPWARAQKEAAETKNSLLFPISRNPARENLYKWVSKVFIDPVCFFTVKPQKAVMNADDIKKLGSVGVYVGGAEESYVNELGIGDRKDGSVVFSSLVSKLALKRIDSVLAGTLAVRSNWTKNKMPQEDLQCGIPYTNNLHSIAASLSSDDSFVEDLRKEMEKYLKTEDYKKLLKKYDLDNVEFKDTIRKQLFSK